jgi:membrane protein
MQIPGLHGTSPVELLKNSVKDFLKDDMPTYSAALAYGALFALFPFLIFLIALLGFLNIPEFFDWLLDQGKTALPADAFSMLEDVVTQIRGQARGGLLSIGIVTAIWGASGGVRSVMNAMNVAFDVEETRPIWKRYLLSIVYTIGIAVLLVASAGLMLTGPNIVESIASEVGLGDLFVSLWTWLRWPVLVVLLMLAAALLYYAAPNVDEPFALITPGAVFAVIIWVIASIGFSLYVSNFANYSSTYGSLGSMVILLLFFYVSSAVLLLGAEINAEVHRIKLGDPVPADGSESGS